MVPIVPIAPILVALAGVEVAAPVVVVVAVAAVVRADEMGVESLTWMMLFSTRSTASTSVTGKVIRDSGLVTHWVMTVVVVAVSNSVEGSTGNIRVVDACSRPSSAGSDSQMTLRGWGSNGASVWPPEISARMHDGDSPAHCLHTRLGYGGSNETIALTM